MIPVDCTMLKKNLWSKYNCKAVARKRERNYVKMLHSIHIRYYTIDPIGSQWFGAMSPTRRRTIINKAHIERFLFVNTNIDLLWLVLKSSLLQFYVSLDIQTSASTQKDRTVSPLRDAGHRKGIKSYILPTVKWGHAEHPGLCSEETMTQPKQYPKSILTPNRILLTHTQLILKFSSKVQWTIRPKCQEIKNVSPKSKTQKN